MNFTSERAPKQSITIREEGGTLVLEGFISTTEEVITTMLAKLFGEDGTKTVTYKFQNKKFVFSGTITLAQMKNKDLVKSIMERYSELVFGPEPSGHEYQVNFIFNNDTFDVKIANK